jgi:hypothetical protein
MGIKAFPPSTDCSYKMQNERNDVFHVEKGNLWREKDKASKKEKKQDKM